MSEAKAQILLGEKGARATFKLYKIRSLSPIGRFSRKYVVLRKPVTYEQRDEERRKNNEEYGRIKDELIKHKGKYAVIARGKLQGIFNSFEEAKMKKIEDANHILLY